MPSHAGPASGWRPLPSSSIASRHSYSRNPSRNWPSSSSASERFQCARANSRIDLDRAPEGGDGPGEVVQRLQRESQIVPCDRVIGLERERAPVRGDRLVRCDRRRRAQARGCCGTRAPRGPPAPSASSSGSAASSSRALVQDRRRDNAAPSDVRAPPRAPRGTRARRLAWSPAWCRAERRGDARIRIGGGAPRASPRCRLRARRGTACISCRCRTGTARCARRPADARDSLRPARAATSPRRGPAPRRACGARSRRRRPTCRARCSSARAARAAASARSRRRMPGASAAISAGGTVRQKLNSPWKPNGLPIGYAASNEKRSASASSAKRMPCSRSSSGRKARPIVTSSASTR